MPVEGQGREKRRGRRCLKGKTNTLRPYTYRNKNWPLKGKDNGIYAYITQEFTSIGENGFDVVVLNVVLLKNAEFEFYNSYNSLTNTASIGGLDIKYSISCSLFLYSFNVISILYKK